MTEPVQTPVEADCGHDEHDMVRGAFMGRMEGGEWLPCGALGFVPEPHELAPHLLPPTPPPSTAPPTSEQIILSPLTLGETPT